MKENIFNFVSKWGKFILLILGITLGLWIFAVKAPFIFILCWTITIIGVPMIYYNKNRTFEFWIQIFGWNLFKGLAAIFLFLLIRAYFTKVIYFTPLESWVKFTENSGTSSLFGYTPETILFEATFLILAGLMCIKALFGTGKSTNFARVSAGLFLIGCFGIQVFTHAVGPKIVNEAQKPLYEEKIAKEVKERGIVGAVWKQTQETLFGEGCVIKKSYQFTMQAGEKKGPFHSFKGYATGVRSTPDSDYIIKTESGEIYRKGDKYPPLIGSFYITAIKDSTIEFRPVEL